MQNKKEKIKITELEYIKQLSKAYKTPKEIIIQAFNLGGILVFDHKSLIDFYADIEIDTKKLIPMMHSDIKNNVLVAVGSVWFYWG